MLLWLSIYVAYNGLTAAVDQNESITVYDETGIEYLIPRDTYRTDVLPGTFEKAWNDEEALYSAIVATLHDEFY